MRKMEKKRTWEERSSRGCLEFCASDGLRVDHCLPVPLKVTLRNYSHLRPASSPPLDIQFITGTSRDEIE